MLIKRVQARHFMRYAKVDLRDLPDRGIVAVLGDNESGKSTLGECVAFGLFGETIKSRLTDLSQVVSWDADDAWVRLELELAGHRRYAIERRVDKHGGHAARLIAADQSEVVEGPEAVAARLAELKVPSFNAFRMSFYLAQQEVDLLRRDPTGDARSVVESILGIAALEDAARTLRDDAGELAGRHELLARELAVAEEVARAQAVPIEAGQALEDEATRHQQRLLEAEQGLPTSQQRVAALRDAVAARAACGNAYNNLQRALTARAAEAELTGLGAELSGIRRGVEAEVVDQGAVLTEAQEAAGTLRERIDRLIGYRTEMAQLEARLELYRNEVKRNLEAPEVDDQDLIALEGLAMPSTPAAGARLAELRVERVRRAKSRAQIRCLLFFIAAVVLGCFGLPALSHLVDEGQVGSQLTVTEAIVESEALGRLTRMARGIENGLEAAGVEPTRGVWAGIAIVGTAGMLSGFLLVLLSLGQAFQRGDELKLAVEAHARLLAEVEALQRELGTLEQINLKRPIEMGDRVTELRNPAIRQAYDAIRSEHPDFLAADVQGEALVRYEREQETHKRKTAVKLEDRLSRIGRVLRSLPAKGSAYLDPRAAPIEVPTDLVALETKTQALLERFGRSQRDLREVLRSGGGGEPRARLASLRQELLRVLAVGAAGVAEAGEIVTRLEGVVAGPPSSPEALEDMLELEADRLDAAMPGADDLVALRKAAEEQELALAEQFAVARGSLDTLKERLARVRAQRKAHEERLARVAALKAEVDPLAAELRAAVLAADLLDETAGEVRGQSGPRLAAFAAAVLPKLTGGRYRKVEVSPELAIKVYSPEKNDLVPIIDLSIGTADQLLLALRLGLGVAYLNARGAADRHFLFLDEPLASFDESRAKAFLELLEASGDVFPQVFLVAHHHFGALESMFARVVRTELATRALLSDEGETGTVLLEPTFEEQGELALEPGDGDGVVFGEDDDEYDDEYDDDVEDLDDDAVEAYDDAASTVIDAGADAFADLDGDRAP